MAIRNKDGKPLRLNHPSPLGKTQESIDLSRAILHNFTWDAIKQETEVPPSLPPVQVEKDDMEEFKAALEAVVEETTQTEPPETAQPTIEVVDAEEVPEPTFKKQVLFHCLPGKLVDYEDAFYGDKYSKVEYGKKFVFPGVVIDENDFAIQFWTTDPKQQVTEHSIIYPFAYEIFNNGRTNRVPYDEYRWWRVSKKTKQEDGYLFEATPSLVQPDFSD